MADGHRGRDGDASADDGTGLDDPTSVSDVTITDDAGAEVDIPDSVLEDDSPETGENAARAWLSEQTRNVVTKEGLGIALALSVVGGLAFGAVVPFGIIGNLLGVFVAAFLYGTATHRRHYSELTLAGGTVGAILALLGNLTLTFVGVGAPVVAIGAVGGVLAGLLGHYFGRDLRDGLTRET